MKTTRSLLVLLLLTLATVSSFTKVSASPSTQTDAPWCGVLGEDQNFGFTFPLKQQYWTVNSDGFIKPETVTEAESILKGLNDDNIVNIMAFFMDARNVAVGSNCAGQFNYYMKLGNTDGPRVDNGFTMLFTVTRDSQGIAEEVKVNYALGGNLEKLHADDLKEMNRIAQKTFSESGSVDITYLSVLSYFNETARSKYEPYHPSATAPVQNTQPTSPYEAALRCIAFLFVMALAFVALMIIAWILDKLGLLNVNNSNTGTYRPSHSDNNTSTNTHRNSSSNQGKGSGNTTRTG